MPLSFNSAGGDAGSDHRRAFDPTVVAPPNLRTSSVGNVFYHMAEFAFPTNVTPNGVGHFLRIEDTAGNAHFEYLKSNRPPGVEYTVRIHNGTSQKLIQQGFGAPASDSDEVGARVLVMLTLSVAGIAVFKARVGDNAYLKVDTGCLPGADPHASNEWGLGRLTGESVTCGQEWITDAAIVQYESGESLPVLQAHSTFANGRYSAPVDPFEEAYNRGTANAMELALDVPVAQRATWRLRGPSNVPRLPEWEASGDGETKVVTRAATPSRGSTWREQYGRRARERGFARFRGD